MTDVHQGPRMYSFAESCLINPISSSTYGERQGAERLSSRHWISSRNVEKKRAHILHRQTSSRTSVRRGGPKMVTTGGNLDKATFTAMGKLEYPYYVIQLNRDEELPLDGKLVSDAIVEYLKKNEVTHVFIQTHGWATKPENAIKTPFSQFIGGMQDDPNMPSAAEGFNPLFVAFIWDSIPYSFWKAETALERAQLVEDQEKQMSKNEDTSMVKAIRKARQAVAEENVDSAELKTELVKVAEESVADDDEEDEGDDERDPNKIVETATVQGDGIGVVEGAVEVAKDVFGTVFKPVETLLFGRLRSRGRRTGKVMQSVIAKFMQAVPDRNEKYCLMANSLGGHVIAGALLRPQGFTQKVHTMYFVQGAVERKAFKPGGKYHSIQKYVAGPIVCTTSSKDTMLSVVFDTFYADAIGSEGFPQGKRLFMKSREELGKSSYEMEGGEWHTIDATAFIDEGKGIDGSHSDFKEDETTMAYWDAINMELPEEAYTVSGSKPKVSEDQGTATQNLGSLWKKVLSYVGL